MDINRANPFCAPHRQSGVFVRRRRTYVTRMNELHVHYREIPLYHPYAMRTPIRVEKKSTVVTTTIDEDFFVPCQSGPAKMKGDKSIHRPRNDSSLRHPNEIESHGLFAHPELPSGSSLGIKSEEEYANVPGIKLERFEPPTPNKYQLRPVEWYPRNHDGTKYVAGCGDQSPPTLVEKAIEKQRQLHLHGPDALVHPVKTEPVD